MRLGIVFAMVLLVLVMGCSKNEVFSSHKIDSKKIIFDENEIIINEKDLFVGVFQGESMIPSLTPKSTVIYRNKFKSVNIGDVIIFNMTKSDCKNLISPTGLIAHRFIEIKENFYITKGDNNYKNDDCKVTFDKIEGVIIGVIY